MRPSDEVDLKGGLGVEELQRQHREHFLALERMYQQQNIFVPVQLDLPFLERESVSTMCQDDTRR